MENLDEVQALTQVCEGLLDRFPDLTLDTIRSTVEQEHGRLAGRPVRNYVPVLVERAARARLAELSDTGIRVPA